MADDKAVEEVNVEKKTKTKTKTKTKRSFWTRIWCGLFRLHGDDFEKRLQYISREEIILLNRIKRRSSSWRSTARNLIVISVFLEVIALGYAIITTRTAGLDWQMRAMRVLPIFLVPALSAASYWALFSFTRMRDSRDQNTIDSLRAERQAKIDELKERTNYYSTQQLIQKYDPDPAAKAAAASVLASKLGADSGLKMFIGDELQQNSETTGKSNDIEPVKSTGLRKRNTSDATTPKAGNDQMETVQNVENEVFPNNQVVVQHQNPANLGSQDGGWLAKVAQLLVGEDPSQSYALICGNCHMHNGLARKEDFPLITYYCPRCHALNRPRNSSPSGASTSATSPTMENADLHLLKPDPLTADTSEKVSAATSPVVDTDEKVSATSTPVVDAAHATEKVSATSTPVVETREKESAPVADADEKVSGTSTPMVDAVHTTEKVSATSGPVIEKESAPVVEKESHTSTPVVDAVHTTEKVSPPVGEVKKSVKISDEDPSSQ